MGQRPEGRLRTCQSPVTALALRLQAGLPRPMGGCPGLRGGCPGAPWALRRAPASPWASAGCVLVGVCCCDGAHSSKEPATHPQSHHWLAE
jgi:hypothetical protein